MTRGPLLTVACLALVTAGCSDDLAVPTTDSRPRASNDVPAEMTAVVQQWREDEVSGTFLVGLTNATDHLVHVDTLAVEWSGFAQPAASRPDHGAAPGVRIDLAVPVVEAQCSDPPQLHEAFPAEPATVVVNGTYRVPVTGGEDVLQRMFDGSCLRQAVAHHIELGFGETWEVVDIDGEPAVRGQLLVAPRHAGAVEVAGIDGSVVLTLEPVDGLDVVDGAITVDVGRGGRCDAHALGESKKTYVFQVSLLIDGEPVDVSITPDQAAKDQMYHAIELRCGLA